MSTLATPYNIQSYAAALAECLEYGDRLHVGVCGNQVSEDLVFIRFHEEEKGIVVARRDGNGSEAIIPPLFWGDIVELWPLDEKPNPYHSDIPEVAEVLAFIRVAIKIYVQDNNAASVKYLLDEIVEARRAEPLLKEARKVLAGIRV